MSMERAYVDVPRSDLPSQTLLPRSDAAGATEILLTAAEHAARRRELARLRELRDRELPAAMREARTFVTADAVEEIAQVQEEQMITAARIARLEDLLADATVAADDHSSDVVSVGCTVRVEYRRTGRRAVYGLTGAGSGSGGAYVSARSPVGQALMGRRVGDVVTAELPGGRTEHLRILTVARPERPVQDA
jgi:transcription elongation factor GreA